MHSTVQDMYSSQRVRIERIVGELAPGKRVEFDESSTLIKFRVRDDATRLNLTEASGDWFPDELAEKSDAWLRDFVLQLSNGKLRR